MWRFRFQSANKHHRLETACCFFFSIWKETPNILGCDSPKADKFHVCYCDRHYARDPGVYFWSRKWFHFKKLECCQFHFPLFKTAVGFCSLTVFCRYTYVMCKLNRWYTDIWHLPFLLTIHLLIYLHWHWFFRIRLFAMPHWLIELVSILCQFIWFLRVFDFAPHLLASFHLAKHSIRFLNIWGYSTFSIVTAPMEHTKTCSPIAKASTCVAWVKVGTLQVSGPQGAGSLRLQGEAWAG